MSHIREWTPTTAPSGAAGAAAAPARPPAVYQGLRRAVRPVLDRLFDFRVTGLEHVPPAGPFIVAANHANYLDGVVLSAALPHHVVYLVMPRVYHASPLHPVLHRSLGSIPVSLLRPDPGAIRRALRVLERGGVLGIFPEGPCGRDGRLAPGQPGVALVALRSGVPVLPAAIAGTFEALDGRRWHVPRRVPLAVRFGRPLRFTRPGRRPVTQGVRRDVTGRIMDEIVALLAAGAPVAAPAGVGP
jgi:1-acyl-sn-glycerol-3-phosphate acyltransferase